GGGGHLHPDRGRKRVQRSLEAAQVTALQPGRGGWFTGPGPHPPCRRSPHGLTADARSGGLRKSGRSGAAALATAPGKDPFTELSSGPQPAAAPTALKARLAHADDCPKMPAGSRVAGKHLASRIATTAVCSTRTTIRGRCFACSLFNSSRAAATASR